MVADTYGPSWGKSGNLRLKKKLLSKNAEMGGGNIVFFRVLSD
jgi:hypothetical protein